MVSFLLTCCCQTCNDTLLIGKHKDREKEINVAQDLKMILDKGIIY